jgi:hypothetical protein
MHLVTNGYDLFIARNIHESFSRKAGSHRIASAFSLCHLSRLIRVRRPKAVLEIGAGIGAISELILLHQEKVDCLYSIESDPCRCAALRDNLRPREGQTWNLLSSHEEIPRTNSFDLIVFDGNQIDRRTLRFLHAETAVFIDGMRRRARDGLIRYCEGIGLSLRLHEYSGTWHVVMQGLGKSRSAPALALERERCHLGVCQPMFPPSEVGWANDHVACAGVETA